MITKGKAMSGKSPGDGSRAHQRARLAKLNLGTRNWIGQYRTNGNGARTSPDRHARAAPASHTLHFGAPQARLVALTEFPGTSRVQTPTANHNSVQGISDQGLRGQ